MSVKQCSVCFKDWEDDCREESCAVDGHRMLFELLPPNIKRPRLLRCTRCGRTPEDIKDHDAGVQEVLGEEDRVCCFPLCDVCDYRLDKGLITENSRNECCIRNVPLCYVMFLNRYVFIGGV